MNTNEQSKRVDPLTQPLKSAFEHNGRRSGFALVKGLTGGRTWCPDPPKRTGVVRGINLRRRRASLLRPLLTTVPAGVADSGGDFTEPAERLP